MGQLIDGTWSTENVLFNHDDKGLYFKRDSVFRDRIGSDQRTVASQMADAKGSTATIRLGAVADRRP